MLTRIKNKIKEETGNTIIMFLIIVPVMLGMFGIAADAIIFVNVKMGVQSSLDSAAVVYANQTVDLPQRYRNKYIATYKNNLDPFKGFLYCAGSPCGNTPTIVSNSGGKVTLKVQEKMNFIFIDNATPILDAIAPGAADTVNSFINFTTTSTATIR